MMCYNFEQSQRNTVLPPLKEKCLFYFSSVKEAQALGDAELSSLWKEMGQHGWFSQGKTKLSLKWRSLLLAIKK